MWYGELWGSVMGVICGVGHGPETKGADNTPARFGGWSLLSGVLRESRLVFNYPAVCSCTAAGHP